MARKMIGTVEFSVHGRVLDISPVYEGETGSDYAVISRGRRAFAMLRDPQSDPLPDVIFTAQRKFTPAQAVAA